ncbi:hypothetical protein HDV01_007885 [Terramyces sp. JEL0728]|nr:hypothetical protein HDV01_007885 [Terramyces sp. JEL0728]
MAIAADPTNDPQYVGQCLSTTYDFSDMNRLFSLDSLIPVQSNVGLDVGRYDFTIDYNQKNVKQAAGGGLELLITANGNDNPLAPRVSSTRFIRYAKISAVLKAPAISGIVTTFIGMGPQLPDSRFDLSKANPQGGDEIDVEILGKNPKQFTSNVYFRGFQELGPRGGTHDVPSGIDQFHTYTFDWKHNSISWSLDGNLLRTYNKNDPLALNSPNTHGIPFFPDRAMKIQFSLWSDKTNVWAGGAPAWPAGTTSASAVYKSITVQCYDDNDNPVPQWPLIPQNPPAAATQKGQPTEVATGGKIPAAAAPGGSSGGSSGSSSNSSSNSTQLPPLTVSGAQAAATGYATTAASTTQPSSALVLQSSFAVLAASIVFSML